MKKFILKAFLLLSPILMLLIFVNYFGDAARLFDNDYEKHMAEIIDNGKYVTNFVNYDERLFQKELISSKNIKPKLVIIGSSRTMLINSDLFPKSSLFNNSVSGASIGDIIAIYQLYKENHKLPQKIIIGIDPWTFNENSGKTRWKSISEYYYRFSNSKDKRNFLGFKYKELLSFSYFQSSVKELGNIIFYNTKPLPSTNKFNHLATKLTDGSLVYGEQKRNSSSKEIENKIKSYLSGEIYGVKNFDVISDKIWTEFEKLIIEIKKGSIEVEFFLSPYAPLVYERVAKEYPMVLKTEQLIKDYARTNNLNLYGSFSPFELEMDESYFYDAMHSKEIGVEKIIGIK
jgi:hypothetical protein